MILGIAHATDATDKGVQDKLRAIGNVFTTKREVSTDEAIVRSLSLPMRSSKINVDFIVTGLKENRTRALKSPETLKQMNPDDPNIYSLNILDKYANRPDHPTAMNYMCLADFATSSSNDIPQTSVLAEAFKGSTEKS